jgi:hypothetical protein
MIIAKTATAIAVGLGLVALVAGCGASDGSNGGPDEEKVSSEAVTVGATYKGFLTCNVLNGRDTVHCKGWEICSRFAPGYPSYDNTLVCLGNPGGEPLPAANPVTGFGSAAAIAVPTPCKSGVDWNQVHCTEPVGEGPGDAPSGYHATGTQNYKCEAVTGGYAWVFIGPQATLKDDLGVARYTHSSEVQVIAGVSTIVPMWTQLNPPAGTAPQVIKGTKVASATVDPTAIPWLLLSASDSTYDPLNSFISVDHVQRLNTAGGKAPTTVCNQANVGTVDRVNYSADYLFQGRKLDNCQSCDGDGNCWNYPC